MDHRKSVLIVDDELKNISIMTEILADDYDVFFARSGEEALEKLQERPIDLTLLDIVMPGMDGFSVCGHIRKEAQFDDMPIIFVTSKDDPNDESRGFEIGCNDYLSKPVSAAIVNCRVRTQLALADGIKIMKEQNKKLAFLSEEKNKLLGMAAHDLRNPIAAIINAIEFIDPMVADKDGRKFLMMMDRSCKALLTLLDDMLYFSTVENLSLSIHKKTVCLTDLVRSQINLLQFLARKKNIEIIEMIPTNISVEIDESRFEQVITNLLSNAIKYGPHHQQIIVQCISVNKEVCLSVKDFGQGISEQEKSELFLPFKILSSKPTGGETSTGLGLAICKKIVDAHNGRFEVKSELGKGSEFSVYLPLN